MTVPQFLKLGLGCLAIACGAGAAACSADPATQTVLTPSPSAAVQAAIDAAGGNEGAFPTFADIPGAPIDRTPEQWEASKSALQEEAADLARKVGAMPKVEAVQAANTAAFDAMARRIAAVPPAPENSRAQAEAFAREMKARATPPPRRPAN